MMDIASPLPSTAVLNCGKTSTLNNQQPFSFFMWVYVRSGGNGDQGTFMAKTSAGGYWGLNFSGVNTQATFFKNFDTVDLNVTFNNPVAFNVWSAVVLTWDGTATASTGVHLYVNNVEIAHNSDQNGSVSAVSDAGNNLTVGNSDVGDQSNAADSLFTEVAFWNKVLTAREIALLSASRMRGTPLQVAPSNLRGYWPCDDFSNGVTMTGTATVRDRGPLGNHASPVSSPVSRAEALISYP